MQLLEIENEQRKMLCMKFRNLDDITRRDFGGHHHLENSTGLGSSGLLQNSTQPVNIPNNSHLSNSLSGKRLPKCSIFRNIWLSKCSLLGLLQGTSAPVNIPDNNFSPNNGGTTCGNSSMFGGNFGQLSGSAPKMNNSFSHTDNMFLQSHLISPVLNDTLSISPDLRYTLDCMNIKRHTFQMFIILKTPQKQIIRIELDEGRPIER